MPDLTEYAACPTCGREYEPPRDADPWTWLPNGAMTRLHAVRRDACPAHPGEACGPPVCGDVDLTNVTVTGHPPPRCKRCLAVVGTRRRTASASTTATYEITVHAYGLTADQLHALFIRVADAAHLLDEEVSVSGGPPLGTPGSDD